MNYNIYTEIQEYPQTTLPSSSMGHKRVETTPLSNTGKVGSPYLQVQDPQICPKVGLEGPHYTSWKSLPVMLGGRPTEM